MDGPEHHGMEGGGIGGAGGLILRLLTALNGRARAMTSGGGWWRVRYDGKRGAWSDEKFGGFGREVVEGNRKGDDVTDPDGPKWTAWSVSRCRDRGLGETEGWIVI